MKQKMFIVFTILLMLVCTEGTATTEEPQQCSCERASNGTETRAYPELQKMRQELTHLKQKVESLDINKLFKQIVDMSKRAKDIEHKMENQTVSVTVLEILQLKKNIEIVKAMAEQLNISGKTEAESAALMKQLQSMLTTVDKMLERIPDGQEDRDSLITDLQSRLNKCNEHIKWFSFSGDSLPINEDYKDWCDTHELDSIGEAYTHGYAPESSGAWFKDPLPRTPEERTQIYMKKYYEGSISYEYQRVFSYDNYNDFLAENSQNNELRFLPDGVGFVIYNQSIYWAKGDSIFRTDLKSGRTLKQKSISKSDVIYYNHYLKTYVDLKVDEFGLWIIIAQAKNENKLVVSRLDPNTLEMVHPYMTNKLKVATCAVFMVCGRLYAIDSCGSRIPGVPHHKEYTYDTLADQDSYTKLHVTSKFGHIYSLNYNPREKIIFGWDDKHLVTFPINWKIKHV